MHLFNIGGEGQLYVGAIVGAAAGARRSATSPAALVDRGDGRRRRRRRRALGADPGRPAGVLLDQRDHHLADAQLRRGADPQLPDLRLASRTGATPRRPRRRSSRRGRRCRTRRRWPVLARRRRSCSRSASCSRSCSRPLLWAALHPHALRLRGAGDRRLAARGALRRHADAPEDPRGDGALGRDRRHRRREPGRRLPPPARPARPDRRRATATPGS